MRPIFRGIRSEPVYKEVEEFGEVRLVLMRKEGYVRYTPAHRVLIPVDPPPGIDIAYDYKVIPAETYSYWEWVKV